MQMLLNYIRAIKTDPSGVMVYATQGGTYFHTVSNCSGMSGASQITLLLALQSGKQACPTCASAAGRVVYCTEGGKYFHTTSNCSGMSGASPGDRGHCPGHGQKAVSGVPVELCGSHAERRHDWHADR